MVNILKNRFTIISVYGRNEDETVANKEHFYETLQRIVTDFGNSRELVFWGDFTARRGRNNNNHIIERFGEHESCDNGASLIDLCEQNYLKITSGFFQHKEIYKFIWTKKKPPEIWNQLLIIS